MENRKGNYLEKTFFSAVKEKSESIKSNRRKIQSLKTRKTDADSETFREREQEMITQLNKLISERERLLMDELEQASLQANSKSFSFGIRETNHPNQKATFTIQQTASSFFCIKQMQSNIRRLYKVKQADRHQIVCQLRETLGDKFPKYVVRIDISSFYESIPIRSILKKLEADHLLSAVSKRLIRRLVNEYGQLIETDIGLPRGIGVSAYLAEIYLREFDEAIRGYPGVVYYARYVDDIAVVFCPAPNQGTFGFRKLIVKKLASLSLTRNRNKTAILTITPNSQHTMEYLGYKFVVGGGAVNLAMTANKVDRYKKRVELAFVAYSKRSKRSERDARRWLVKRLRFLTGNTRLVNSKKHVVSGIFFSNSLLTDLTDLSTLDAHLSNQISSVKSTRLRRLLSNYRFRHGFEKRIYYQFSASELSMIVKVWKDAE